MKSRSWKAAETRFARDVGTERKPCDGFRDGKDFEAGMFGYQLKFRKKFPPMWWNWLSGIVGKCADSNQIGVLVLNRPHHDRKEALVVLRWCDWVALHGEPVIEPEEQSVPVCSIRGGCDRPVTREFCYAGEPWMPYCDVHRPQYGTAGERKWSR